MVSFSGMRRHLGEHAMTQVSSNGANTVTDILSLLGAPAAEYTPSRHNQVQQAAGAAPVAAVAVGYELKQSGDGADGASEEQALAALSTFEGVQLLGMLLAEVKSIADRKAGGKDALLVLAVPDHYTPERRAAAASAAAIGGFDPASVSVVAAAEAAVAGWALKHPQAAVAAEGEGGGDAEDASAAANGAARHVMIVDVGQSTAQATVFKVGRLTADGSPSFEQLNPANTTAVFGVADVDEFVFDNIASKLDSEYQVKVKPGTRRASRLLREAGKARKILSANELTEVVLECFDDRERDFQFKLSRADFDGDCASLKAACTTLVSDALAASGVSADALEAVELIGGGTRIQFVRKAIMDVVGEGKLSQTLDGAAAVALGATLLAPARGAEDAAAAPALPEGLAAQVALEVQMSVQDMMLVDIDSEKNALETFIYETRGAGDSEFKEHFDVDKTLPLLAEAEDWLFGDEGDAINQPGPAKAKLEELTAKVAALNPNYLKAVEDAQLKKEAEMEAERMKAAAEAALAGPADDHDSRKLKKADRMKHVTKNKAEGTDLFKGGNYLHAQNRYVKALVHCGKFMSDLTPEDEQEVKTLKESLHLNLAMCYLKLEEWKKAKASCDSALEFNETVKGT